MKKHLIFFIFCFICIFIHYHWIQTVDPFPENDSVFSFYYPILNYLKASLLVGNDFYFITQFTHRGDYPLGSALLSYLLSCFALNKIILEVPYVLSFSILLFACIIPLFFKSKNKALFTLLICTNPFTVLCIRSLSPHGFNIFFSLLSLLFLKNYLSNKNKALNLIAFTIFSVFSISIKHLGLIYFANLAFAYTIFAAINGKKDYKLYFSFIVSFIIGVTFYPVFGLKNYLTHVLEYKKYTSLDIILFVVFTTIALCLITYSFHFKAKRKFTMPRLFGWGFTYITFVLLALFFLLNGVFLDLSTCTLIIILSLTPLWLAYTYLKLHKIKHFIYIFIFVSFTCSSVLFLSDLGRSFYLFFLPILVLFIHFISKSRNPIFLSLILIIQVLISNFFPSNSFLIDKFGARAETKLVLLFNSTHINYFTWNKCHIPEIRKKINNELKHLNLPDESYLMMQQNLHFFTKSVLYLPYSLIDSGPSFYRIDNQTPKVLQETLSAVRRDKTKAYKDFINKHKFPLIMEGTSPFVSIYNEHKPPLQSLLESNQASLNQFAQALERDYFKFLKQSNSLQDRYISFNIPENKPIIKLHLLKHFYLPQNAGRLNSAVSDLILEYKNKNP